MLRVCTLMNRVEDHYPELERSCIERDIPLFANIVTGEWSWKGKVEWELDWCRRYPDDTFVFIDAFDMLCVGARDELEAAANAHLLLFQVDKNIGDGPWPLRKSDCGQWDARRPRLSDWNYLNGSGPVGKGHAIIRAIEHGMVYPFFEPGTDQMFWQRVYLDGFGELDQGVTISQPLWGLTHGKDLEIRDGRVYNTQTGSRPQFIHATGRTWAWIPDDLKPKVVYAKEDPQ